MLLLIYTYMHTRMHTYIHTYKSTYKDGYVQSFRDWKVHTCIHACHAWMQQYTPIHTHTQTYIHKYIHTYILFACIHTYETTQIHAYTHAYIRTCTYEETWNSAVLGRGGDWSQVEEISCVDIFTKTMETYKYLHMYLDTFVVRLDVLPLCDYLMTTYHTRMHKSMQIFTRMHMSNICMCINSCIHICIWGKHIHIHTCAGDMSNTHTHQGKNILHDAL